MAQVVGTSYSLVSSHALRKAIDQDIASLRKANFVTKWSVTGQFVKVEDSQIWVYQHLGHVAASNVFLKNIRACINIVYDPPVARLCRGEQHYLLETFFCDNKALRFAWEDHPDMLVELDRAPEYTISGMFATRGTAKQSGLEFSENIWTERLVGSLQRHLPNHHVQCTANDAQNFRNVQARYSLLGNSFEIISCYIFRGCTDAKINEIPVELAGLQDDPDPDPLSSEDDSKIEVGREADPFCEYPPKLGQLVAAIQISNVQKCARMFMKGKAIKEEVKSSGMYINKQAAPFIVKMTMPIVCATNDIPSTLPCAKISITESISRTLSSALLCEGLHQLVGSTQCTP